MSSLLDKLRKRQRLALGRGRRRSPADRFHCRVRMAIVDEAKRFVPHDNYGIRTSPVFWRRVFILVHAEPPAGNDDPRWDTLFSTGYPIMRELNLK